MFARYSRDSERDKGKKPVNVSVSLRAENQKPEHGSHTGKERERERAIKIERERGEKLREKSPA